MYQYIMSAQSGDMLNKTFCIITLSLLTDRKLCLFVYFNIDICKKKNLKRCFAKFLNGFSKVFQSIKIAISFSENVFLFAHTNSISTGSTNKGAVPTFTGRDKASELTKRKGYFNAPKRSAFLVPPCLVSCTFGMFCSELINISVC